MGSSRGGVSFFFLFSWDTAKWQRVFFLSFKGGENESKGEFQRRRRVPAIPSYGVIQLIVAIFSWSFSRIPTYLRFFFFFKKTNLFCLVTLYFGSIWRWTTDRGKGNGRRRRGKRGKNQIHASSSSFFLFSNLSIHGVCRGSEENQSCSKFEIRSQPPPVVRDPKRSWERKWGKTSNPFEALPPQIKVISKENVLSSALWRTQVLK